MDPLSMTASIIAVLQLSTSVLGIINSIKEATEGRASLAIELSNLNTLLIQLTSRVDTANSEDAWFAAIRSLALPSGPFDQLKSHLEKLQSAAEPKEGIRELGRKLTWKFDKTVAEGLKTRIEQLKSLIGLALNNDLFELCLALKTDFANTKFDMSEILKVMQEIQKDQEDVKLDSVSQEHTKISNWFSSLEFWSRYQSYLAVRHPETGQWLLDSELFRTWLDGSERMLLLTGIPGAGKTILSSVVIDHILASRAGADIGVAWIYCNYKEQSEQSNLNLLASLLMQLLNQRRELSSEVERIYKLHSSRGSHPALEEISDLLQSEIKTFSRVYFIVDALDEMGDNNASRAAFAEELGKLPNNTSIMATTRHIPAIEAEFAMTKTLEIRAIDEDVTKYVATRISSERLLARHVSADPTLEGEIITKTVNNVQGMFLMAKLNMDSIAGKPSRKAIRTALDCLPSGLDATYDEAMQRIKAQPPDMVELAERVLCWVAFSLRTLSLSELQHAVAMEPGIHELDDDMLPDEEVLISACLGLVIVNKENNTVHLTHETTQKYFDKNHETQLPNAHRYIISRCIAYLSLDVFGEGYNNVVYEKIYPRLLFTKYAARHWPNHALDIAQDESAAKMVIDYLRAPSKLAWANEFHHFPWSRNFGQRLKVHKKRFEGSQGMHLAAVHGLCDFIEGLLGLGQDINFPDLGGRTPLHYVAEFGKKSSVQFLLSKQQLDVNARDNNGEGVLSIAVRGGKGDIVAQLLEHPRHPELDVNLKDNRGRTAFSWAVSSGREKIIEEFLAHPDIDICSKDTDGHTPMSLAVFYGRTTAVKMLLGKPGINLTDRYELKDYSEQGMSNLTLLHLALGRPMYFKLIPDHVATLKLLLATKSIDVDERDGWGATVLHRSTNRYIKDALKALLEVEGVDVNATDSNRQTPLHWASRHNTEAMRILIEQDSVNLNAQDEDGNTALHLLAKGLGGDFPEENFHLEIERIRILLQLEGIDVNLSDSKGRTPLMIFLERRAAQDDVVEDAKDIEEVMEEAKDVEEVTNLFLIRGAVI